MQIYKHLDTCTYKTRAHLWWYFWGENFSNLFCLKKKNLLTGSDLYYWAISFSSWRSLAFSALFFIRENSFLLFLFLVSLTRNGNQNVSFHWEPDPVPLTCTQLLRTTCGNAWQTHRMRVISSLFQWNLSQNISVCIFSLLGSASSSLLACSLSFS